METRIKLRLADLHAALKCAATEETRYYLNGVLVETDEQSKTIRVVATDGQRMFVAVHPSTEIERSTRIIVPRDAIAKLPKGKRAPETVELVQGLDTRLEITDARIGEPLTPRVSPVDGVYPEWVRVVPTDPDGEPSRFDPKLCGCVGDIAKIYGKTVADIRVEHNGQGPALFTWNDEAAFVVLMPMREPTGRARQPSARELVAGIMRMARRTV